MFRALSSRVESLELAGPVERLRSTVVGGIKHMPVVIRSARREIDPSGG